jgi:SHS2 domain-containing protein
MSAWTRPTTADIGLRVFAPNINELFRETTTGMQNILLSAISRVNLNSHMRHSSQWNVSIEKSVDNHNEMLLVKWLEEVLFRAEIHDEFLTEVQIILTEDDSFIFCNAQVDWVDVSLIEREIEIKAVTTHELKVEEVDKNVELNSIWEEVPNFIGPGWYCDIVFDI